MYYFTYKIRARFFVLLFCPENLELLSYERGTFHGSNFIWDDEKLTIINRKSVNALIAGSQSLYSDSDMFGKEKTLVRQESNLDMNQIHITLRRMWDSNPREVLPSGGLVNRCLQPLGQSSSIFTSFKLSPCGEIGRVSATLCGTT